MNKSDWTRKIPDVKKALNPLPEDIGRIVSMPSRVAAEVVELFKEFSDDAAYACQCTGAPPIEVATILSKSDQAISEKYLELLSIQEEHERTRDEVTLFIQENTAHAIVVMQKKYNGFIKGKEKLICDDLTEKHRAWTGINNVIEQSKQAVRKLGSIASWKFEEKPATLIEQVIVEHLGREKLELFEKTLLEAIALESKKRWTHFSKQKFESMSIDSKKAVLNFKNTVPLQSDLATELAKFGFSSIVGSTFILAAGWHTLAWSLTGLFLPAVVALSGVTAIVAFLRKEKELEKLKETTHDYASKILEIIRDRIDTIMRLELQKANRECANRIEKRLFQFSTDGLSRKEFAHILKVIDKHKKRIHRLRFNPVFESYSFLPPAHELSVRARNTLKQGDPLGALFHAAIAFESMLKNIALRKNVDLENEKYGHNQHFIDSLREHPSFSDADIKRLHGLRRYRNEAMHALGLLASESADALYKRALTMIEGLEWMNEFCE